jgi:hypothetical protein
MARVQQRQRESWQIDRLFIAPNIFGDTWYVDVTNGNDSNTGKDPKGAFKTLGQARSDSAAGDTIVIAPGTYPIDVGTASLAPKANQKWIAANPCHGGAPSVIIVADADDHVNTPVAVDVNNVHFEGIELKLVAGGTTALYCIEAAQTTAVRGLVFVDCWINLNGVDAVVIGCRFNDASNAITGLVMKNCRLIGATATTSIATLMQIGVGGIPDCLIEDNIFAVQSNDGDAVALDFLDPGAAVKSYASCIRNNDFIGPSDGGGDGVPIKFASAMTEDEIVGMIRTNYFSNVTTAPITIDKVNNSVIRNYGGDDATGGTLADPGS